MIWTIRYKKLRRSFSLDEIPEKVRKQMNFVLIDNVMDAVKEALV